jgi:hypothetical protein
MQSLGEKEACFAATGIDSPLKLLTEISALRGRGLDMVYSFTL